MADPSGWVEKWTQRVLSWFSQREVKTPLAFYFRVVGAVVVLVLAATYFAIPEQRFRIFVVGIIALAGLAVIVALFAWLNVKNLVYGESGHRAETRIKFGTEKSEVSPETLAMTPGTSNPRAIPSTDQHELPGDAGTP